MTRWSLSPKNEKFSEKTSPTCMTAFLTSSRAVLLNGVQAASNLTQLHCAEQTNLIRGMRGSVCMPANFRREPSAMRGPTARPSHFAGQTLHMTASEGNASVAAAARSSQRATCLAGGCQAGASTMPRSLWLEPPQTDRARRAGLRCPSTTTGRGRRRRLRLRQL